MRKVCSIILLICLLSLFYTGCGKKDINKTDKQPKTNDIVDSSNKQSKKDPEFLTKQDFIINIKGNEVFINDDNVREKLESILGKGKVTTIEDEVYKQGGFYYNYEKDGVKATFINGELLDILLIENPEYTTYRGLKVGDSYDKMVKLYGEGKIITENEDNIIYSYHSNEIDFAYLDLYVTIDKSTNTVVDYYFASTL